MQSIIFCYVFSGFSIGAINGKQPSIGNPQFEPCKRNFSDLVIIIIVGSCYLGAITYCCIFHSHQYHYAKDPIAFLSLSHGLLDSHSPGMHTLYVISFHSPGSRLFSGPYYAL